MATITDLGFTSNGKRLYHVLTDSDDTTVNIPCMQILATVPEVTFAENKLTTVTAETAYLVIAA